jgi:hypothetical protein
MKKVWVVTGLTLALLHCGIAAAGVLRYTQTCGNGDRFAVDMTARAVSITRENVTWRGNYDELGRVKWDSANPAVPAGLQLPARALVTSDGAMFSNGNVDDASLCPIDR